MINHNKLICNIFLDDNDRVTKLGNKLSKKTSQNRYPNIYAYIQQVKKYRLYYHTVLKYLKI